MNKIKILEQLIVFFIITEHTMATDVQFKIYIKEINQNRSINELVIIPKISTSCPMYGKSCEIPVYFQKDVEIIFQTSDNRFFKFLKIETCNKTDDLQDKFSNSSTSFAYTLKCILIDSIIVGKGSILIKYDNDSMISHDVIIISPQRTIDFVQQYFIIVFQTIISIFMGVLLDLETIVKIIKMPIPVLIGFVCQYLGMPIVRGFI